MAPRAELRLPALAREVQTAAEYFVDVAHGEGHVVESALSRRDLQQEQVMVAAARCTAHEGSAVGIAVRGHEAEAVAVERAGRQHVVHEEHDVADFNGYRALIN